MKKGAMKKIQVVTAAVCDDRKAVGKLITDEFLRNTVMQFESDCVLIN